MTAERKRSRKGFIACLTIAIQLFLWTAAKAEDGYRLWLRYDSVPKAMIEVYRPRVTSIVAPGGSATMEAIRSELINGCAGLLGGSIPAAEKVERDGAIFVGTPKSSPLIAGLKWGRQLSDLGSEGFRIRSLKLGPHAVTVIASDGEIGALYGAFHFLRLIQTLQPIGNLCPKKSIRACASTPAPTRQSASTGRRSITSTPIRVA